MTFAIQDSQGAHLGFLLCAGDEEQGDCIFRSLPVQRADFDRAETEMLYQLQQAGEFSYRRAHEGLAISHPAKDLTIVVEGEVLRVGQTELRAVRVQTS